MRSRAIWTLLAVTAPVLVIGFWRFNIDVDVFNLLPTESRMAAGLKLYERSFGSSQELVVSLRSPKARVTEGAARSLAEALAKASLYSKLISA